MKWTRFYLMILSFLLLNVISLYGLNVSILIFQKDGIDKVSESSRVFENQIMNTLFDYGHIVTNETISLYENYDMASVNGFNAAVDGFMDYFVEIKLEYDISQSKNPEAVSLENLKSVDYVIKKVSTGEVFYKSEVISPNKATVSNQYVGFNRFACEIADNINLKISGRM